MRIEPSNHHHQHVKPDHNQLRGCHRPNDRAQAPSILGKPSGPCAQMSQKSGQRIRRLFLSLFLFWFFKYPVMDIYSHRDRDPLDTKRSFQLPSPDEMKGTERVATRWMGHKYMVDVCN